jgi:hypothetical protein
VFLGRGGHNNVFAVYRAVYEPTIDADSVSRTKAPMASNPARFQIDISLGGPPFLSRRVFWDWSEGSSVVFWGFVFFARGVCRFD